MGPVGHSLISAGIGAGVWGATGSVTAAGTALAAGVLIDVDHLFDYYQWYGRRKSNKIYLFLHAWEYSIAGFLVLGLAYYHPVLLGLFLAHFGHVVTDHFHNHLSRWSYFISYRVFVRFETSRIIQVGNVLDSYKSWLTMIPFGKHIEPWYQHKIEPWFRSRIDD